MIIGTPFMRGLLRQKRLWCMQWCLSKIRAGCLRRICGHGGKECTFRPVMPSPRRFLTSPAASSSPSLFVISELWCTTSWATTRAFLVAQ